MANISLQKLQESPLKSTPKRIAIIEIFNKTDRFLTPEQVYQKLSRRFEECGLPGVYRNLEAMTECGILTRIFRFDNKRYYGLCAASGTEHHHHIVCVHCGKVGEVSGCDLFQTTRVNGFKIVDHFLQLDGVCPDCQKG